MKIAISVVEPSLDSEVYPRFGRSQYFIVIDPKTTQYETVTNPNTETPSGAGISAAQLVFNKGASAVITGSIGPKAQQALAAAGVRMLTGVSGPVRDAVADFNAGKLFGNAKAGGGTEGGAGMQGDAGMGRGMGMGRGSGRGMGRGMGCGGGKGMRMGGARGGGAGRIGSRDWAAEPWGNSVRPAGGPDELSSLKQQARRLAEELSRIRQRIGQLEKK